MGRNNPGKESETATRIMLQRQNAAAGSRESEQAPGQKQCLLKGQAEAENLNWVGRLAGQAGSRWETSPPSRKRKLPLRGGGRARSNCSALLEAPGSGEPASPPFKPVNPTRDAPPLFSCRNQGVRSGAS